MQINELLSEVCLRKRKKKLEESLHLLNELLMSLPDGDQQDVSILYYFTEYNLLALCICIFSNKDSLAGLLGKYAHPRVGDKKAVFMSNKFRKCQLKKITNNFIPIANALPSPSKYFLIPHT